MNQKTENWRAVLELEASDGPPLPMKTTAQLLAQMMLRGKLDALDEPPNAERPATTPE